MILCRKNDDKGGDAVADKHCHNGSIICALWQSVCHVKKRPYKSGEKAGYKYSRFFDNVFMGLLHASSFDNSLKCKEWSKSAVEENGYSDLDGDYRT